jgi:hypothetical protein
MKQGELSGQFDADLALHTFCIWLNVQLGPSPMLV